MSKKSASKGARPNTAGTLFQAPDTTRWLQMAMAMHQQGQLAQARQMYEQVLAHQPRHAEALHLLGILAAQTGHPEPAVELFRRAIAVQPQHALAHNNLGNALLGLGRALEAVASYDQAIACRADYPEAWFNRGVALQALQQEAAAAESYARTLALVPQHVGAHHNLGNVLLDLGQLDRALQHLEQAIALAPDFTEAYYNRGNVWLALHKAPEALADYARVLQADPQHAKALYNQALAHLLRDDLPTALSSIEAALVHKPDYTNEWSHWLHLRMRACQWENLPALLQRYREDVQNPARVPDPFPALALLDDPALHAQVARHAVQTHLSRHLNAQPPSPRPRGERIRVAYVSADLREHAVAYLTAGLFEHHDRSQFEIIAIRLKTPDPEDAMAQRLAACFDHILDVQDWRDADIVRAARELRLDIAVDLGGHTAGHRPELFAQRMAPVQVSYIGYLGSMGLPCMDYLLADPILVDAGNRPHISECVVTLPCYQVNDTRRPDEVMPWQRRDLGLPDTGFVFACFNNGYKIQPETFERWMRILQAVPDSVLFLYAENPALQTRLSHSARTQGVDPARLVFGEKLLRPQYLARYRLCDLFLDTLPYNAGTTASDALWAGLPVLTCKGQSLPARMAASLLTALGLPELITHSGEAYEALAIELARSPQRMKALRHRLEAQRASSPLFDPAGFARHLEAAYRLMHQRQLNGLPPIDLPLTEGR